MGKKSKMLESLSFGEQLQFAEQPAKLHTHEKSLFIGIPKAHSFGEKRIALTPDAVEVLVARNHKVVIESGAGKGAHFSDNLFSEAGAKIVYDVKEVYAADVILKTSPISNEVMDFLGKGKTILSPIHLPALKAANVELLLRKEVVALAFEYIKDEVKDFPIVHALSEIAGRAAILIAADLLNNSGAGKGVLLGGISGVFPTKIVILGAGTVGESAARAALGFGAQVKVFDNNIYKLRRLQNNLGKRIFTSVLNPGILGRELQTADVAIGAIHAKSGRTPVVVSEEEVKKMPENSVIIDVSIDQGGVFETSEVTSLKKPTFVKHGVIHYGVPNIATLYAQTASHAIANILTPLLIEASENGGFDELIRMKKGIRKGVYVYKGKLTNEHISARCHIKYTDLELLMATGFGG